MGPRLVVSEFPNDNPELHDGLVWACPTPCAPALPTLRLRPSERARVLRPNWEQRTEPRAGAAPLAPPNETTVAAPLHDESVVAVAQIVAVADAIVAVAEDALAEPRAPAPEPSEPPTLSGFEAFVGALSAILAERGSTRAASVVGALLGQTRLARDAFDAETRKTLVGRGILDAKTSRPTPEFSVVARAWHDVLDGTSADLSGCGDKTLDVFGAELLAALVGVPRERSDELRRALRQRGVAAFGMLAAA